MEYKADPKILLPIQGGMVFLCIPPIFSLFNIENGIKLGISRSSVKKEKKNEHGQNQPTSSLVLGCPPDILRIVKEADIIVIRIRIK